MRRLIHIRVRVANKGDITGVWLLVGRIQVAAKAMILSEETEISI